MKSWYQTKMPTLTIYFVIENKEKMAIEVITKEDLQEFRIQILKDIKQLLELLVAKPAKPWLKNSEVKRMLGISASTLQRLRISGKLSSSRVGGIYYYRYDDIERLMATS